MRKRNLLIGALALGGLMALSPLAAKESPSEGHALSHNPTIQESLAREAGKKADEKRKQIVQEAVSALKETFAALKALEDGNREKALQSLANATGKLELVVARDPALALAPVDVSLTTYDVLATADDIMAARKEVLRLLQEGNLPAARELLDSLRSEVVVNVTSIPLATYPEAIKAVTPLIDEGKLDQAKKALKSALATLVVTHHVIPLPLLRADESLVIAEVLAEKQNRSQKENQALSNTLAAVEEQLRLSEALGYGSHEDYEVLKRQLDEIREKVHGGKSGTGFFDKIKASLMKLRADIFGTAAMEETKGNTEKDGTKPESTTGS